MRMYQETHPGMAAIRRRSATVIGWVVFAIAAFVFGYAAFQIFGIVSEDARAGKTTSAMQSYTSGTPDAFLGLSDLVEDGISTEDAINATPEEVAAMDAAAVQAAEEDEFAVDFLGLEETAPDTRAWIRIPGTNINHPVVQGPDNETYLHKGPDGSANRSGAIFMDYRCDDNFTDKNTILYGHRMNNNTMFAELHKYESREFRATHPYIYINLPDGTVLTYRIFAVYEPGNLLSGHPYQVAWIDDEDFVQWAEQDRLRPYYYDSSQSFSPADRVLTLSTCVRGDGGRRFIVQGRLVSHTMQDAAPGAA